MFTGSDFNVSAISTWRTCLLLAMTATLTGACDKAQLLAPTRSTITISAPTQILANGGTAEITAYVIEEAGTPVHNGTTVRFSTTLGTIDPENAQTRNGLARAMFSAGASSGIAEIRATSGSASGGTDNVNMVRITVGAAAVNTITLRANPGSVGPSGGAVELIASVVSEGGQGVNGVTVTFTADQGTLSASTATTNASGEARTTLTTGQETNVTAAAGTKTSGAVRVTLRAGPIVSIACAPSTGTGNCAGLQASAGNSSIVLLTVTKPTGSSTLRNVVLDFGDGESVNLGNLASGSTAVSHAYAGPSGSTPRSYTATVRAEDVNGEILIGNDIHRRRASVGDRRLTGDVERNRHCRRASDGRSLPLPSALPMQAPSSRIRGTSATTSRSRRQAARPRTCTRRKGRSPSR